MRLNKSMYIVVSLMALLLMTAYFYSTTSGERTPEKRTVLAQMGDECDAIAEKAAIALPEQLPFQKLEKYARRMRVFGICMNDRGIHENPTWLTYAQAVANARAAKQGVSENEAFESFKREEMLRASTVAKEVGSGDAPLYWLVPKKLNTR
jgi:hypothetical protein